MKSRMMASGQQLGKVMWVLLCGTMLSWVLGGPMAAKAESPSQWDTGLAPLSIVTNGFVGVRDLLPSVASKLGLGLQMAPDVDGQVNVHLVEVPASQALDGILGQAGLGYEVVGGVLVIHKQGMVTRWFTFDYPVTQRVGRGELEISAGGGGQSSGSSGGEESQNKSHVTSTATMSVWPEVMESLKTLVFAGANLDAQASGGGDNPASVNIADREGRSLVVNPMAGIIEVTAEFDRVQRIDGLLKRLSDSLQRQVAIEVKIMEVDLNKATKTGIDWGTLTGTEVDGTLAASASGPAGSDYFQFVVDSSHLTGTLKALEDYGNIKVLSTPRITTLNNQKAVVRVVREDVYYEAEVAPAVVSNGVATEPVISYTPRTFSIGVILDVTPQVSANGAITLNVHPTISDVVGIAVSPNKDQSPILSIRELDTVGKVQAGQTLVIAGLVSQRTQVKRSGIPLLKDLPLLGVLFGTTSTQQDDVELVMLLTPVLLENGVVKELADAAERELREKM